MKQKWLIIPAHPDDEAKASGLVLKERQKDDEITILVMRLCGEGSPCDRPAWTRKEAIAQRSAEMAEAARYWNARLLWWQPPHPANENIKYTETNLVRMLELLEELDPTHIVTHWSEDQHPDHCGTAEIVTGAVTRMAWRHDVLLYYFDQPNPLKFQPHFQANCHIDLSDPAMLAACLWTRFVHRSQTASIIMENYLKLYKEHGREIGTEYAMAYMVCRIAAKVTKTAPGNNLRLSEEAVR